MVKQLFFFLLTISTCMAQNITYLPFYTEGLISKQELEQINNETPKSKSEILKSSSLYYSIFNDARTEKYKKRKGVFPNENFCVRKSVWESDITPKETNDSLKSEGAKILKCLKESNLISNLTYKKLLDSFNAGKFYYLQDIFSFAEALTRLEENYSEDYFSKTLDKLILLGNIESESKTKILNDISSNSLNEKYEIIEKYGKNYVSVRQRDKFDKENSYLETLDKVFKLIPFKLNYKVNRLKLQQKLNNPLNNGEDEYSILEVEVNGKEYFSSIRKDKSKIRINDIVFDCLIDITKQVLNDLDIKKEYQITIFEQRYLSKSHSGTSILFLFLSHTKGGDLYPQQEFRLHNDISEYDKIRNNEDLVKFFYPFEKISNSKAEKIDYLKSILNNLDKSRKFDDYLDSLIQIISDYDCHKTFTPNFIPNFIFTEWNEGRETYTETIKYFIKSSFGHFEPYKISESLNNDEKEKKAKLEIQINNKTYSISLSKEYFDYRFLLLISKIQNENDLGGKFYSYEDNSEYVAGSISIFFLTKDEYQKLVPNTIRVSEISEHTYLWEDK